MSVNPLLAVAGLIGTAAAVGGGLYFGGVLNSEEKVIEQEPTWHLLSQDSDYTSEYFGKYGQTYSGFLVGIDSNNDSWWIWSYNNRYKKTRKVKNSSFASEVTDAETLKATCKNAYKGIANETEQRITSGEITFKESEIWKFCSSPGRKEIQTVWDMGGAERFSGATQYGGNPKYKIFLAATNATTNRANKQFWKIKEEELKVATGLDSGSIFRDLKDSKNVTLSNNKKTAALQDVCRDAYGQKEDDSSKTTKYPKKDIFRFCSLTGMEPKS